MDKVRLRLNTEFGRDIDNLHKAVKLSREFLGKKHELEQSVSKIDVLIHFVWRRVYNMTSFFFSYSYHLLVAKCHQKLLILLV